MLTNPNLAMGKLTNYFKGIIKMKEGIFFDFCFGKPVVQSKCVLLRKNQFYGYSSQFPFRIFNVFFFLFSALKFTTIAKAMLENLCLDKRKNKFAKFSENRTSLSIVVV